MKEHKWRLFVDESGEFTSVNDRSCVVGFLSRVPTTMAEARVKVSVERAFPELPWPYHASYLNHEVAWLLWFESSPENSEMKVRARQILAAAPPVAQPLLDNSRSMLDDGEEPDYDELTKLREYLEAARGYLAFREQVYERRNRVFELIQKSLNSDPAGSHITVVAGLGSPIGEAIFDDHYLSALTVLLERTASLLARTNDSHSVATYVAQRGVKDPVIGRNINLNRSHLERATAAANFPKDRVRFTLDDVLPYRQGTTGLVMADLLANRVWNTRSASLAEVHEAIQMLGPDPTMLGLSGCAATGSARDELLKGSSAEPQRITKVQPSWAREQAAQWIDVLRKEGMQ